MSSSPKIAPFTRALAITLLVFFQINLFAIPIIHRLPAEFRFGWATAAYHTHGAKNTSPSNWSDWEEKGVRPYDGQPTIDHNQRSGNACGFYEDFGKELALLVETGARIYRFSIDWTQLFPTLESFQAETPNQNVVAYYHMILDSLRAHNIMPIVTLHHFVHPLWFEQMGGFEHEANITHLVRFAQFVATEFGTKIPYIITINEPGPYYIQSYVRGEFPPGNCAHLCPATPCHWSRGLTLAGTVLKNILFAHVAMYQALKAINPDIQVGLAHNVMHFEANQWWNPADFIAANHFDYLFNNTIMHFLKTGIFKFCPNLCGQTIGSLYANIEDNRYTGQKFQDYIGLNYYSRVTVCGLLQTTHATGQEMTDMPYPMHPEGFYMALQEVASLGLPIIVTEAGLADQHDRIRARWFDKHIGVLARALAEGMPVIAVTWWTLTDNFEWNNGFIPKFGAYAMDKTDPTNITFALRPGTVELVRYMRKHTGIDETTDATRHVIIAGGEAVAGGGAAAA